MLLRSSSIRSCPVEETEPGEHASGNQTRTETRLDMRDEASWEAVFHVRQSLHVNNYDLTKSAERKH